MENLALLYLNAQFLFVLTEIHRWISKKWIYDGCLTDATCRFLLKYVKIKFINKSYFLAFMNTY